MPGEPTLSSAYHHHNHNDHARYTDRTTLHAKLTNQSFSHDSSTDEQAAHPVHPTNPSYPSPTTSRRRNHQRPRRPRLAGPLPSLPELSLRLRPPSHLTPKDCLPPLQALTVDKDYLAPSLMATVLRLHILQSVMFLRQSNVKLQEELRDTMKVYGEEKSMLRAQLASLRLDLSELHHDNRTVTTEGETGCSDQSIANGSEAELKRLADFEGETAASYTSRSLQLPPVTNLGPTAKSVAKDSPNASSTSHREKERDHQTTKNLRFTSSSDEKNVSQKENANSKSFLDNASWENKQESQKFLELQRNQEVLRSIGRAQLKEKRQSLIRLPTITSAKRRPSLWDSGKNVSRPKGKSTDFELHPYVEDAIVLSKKHFTIPSIKDPQRSEIILKGSTKRPALNKRKVQFTRPRPQDTGVKSRDVTTLETTAVTEANSLNTSMADVSLEDNTLGNITFDDDVFKHMMNKVPLGSDNTSSKASVKNAKKTDDNSTLNTSMVDDSQDATDDPKASQTVAAADDSAALPPLKINYLAKRNLELHNNNMRVSPLRLHPAPSESPETSKSCKDSDRSVGTKLSLMSQHTEQRKSMYLKDIDPARRNQTLSDIMFAVRSRMRENEEVLRFGQTPRPHDCGLEECSGMMLPKHHAGSVNASSISSLTPRWSNGNGNANSPRKTKSTKKGAASKPDRQHGPTSKRKGSHTAEVQSFLRKMYRQRKTIDRVAGMDYKMAHFAGHRQLRMVAQQA